MTDVYVLQVVTHVFVKSLGQLILASSLEAILLSATIAPSKVKFVATFLYKGYLLLVKVRKSRTYILWHWFPLQNSSITTSEDECPSACLIWNVGLYLHHTLLSSYPSEFFRDPLFWTQG